MRTIFSSSEHSRCFRAVCRENPTARRMTKEETQAIEVEVVEVDGVIQPTRPEPANEARPQQDWRQWQGRVRTLDSRWWPLWVLLGLILVVLMLTVGVVVLVIFVIFRILFGIKRALFG
jgi:hypothetical protein